MLFRLLFMAMTLASLLAVSGCGVMDQTDLQVTAPRTELRVGETVQLSVTQKQPDGSTRDLTGPASGTVYYTTGESVLIPEPDGRVTCIGTNGRDRESAVVGVSNGQHHGHIRFSLLPQGPGPSLQVAADKDVLREGERVQLRVFKPLADGSRKELTDTSTGTQYLTFSGNAMADSGVVTVSGSGLATVTASIGSYNYRTVIVFVRNADDVGWVELKIVHANDQ